MSINFQEKLFLSFVVLGLNLIINSFNVHASYPEHIEKIPLSVRTSGPCVEEVEDDYEDKSSIPPKTSSKSPSVNMPFKLGFEFQEENGLCPWALNDNTVQKKRLFSLVEKKVNTLWHVVIDGNDIEFVTRPFSYRERKDLVLCMNTFHASFDILKKLLNENTNITFSQWIADINATIEHSPLSLKSHKRYPLVEGRPIIMPTAWKPRFTPQATIQHSLEKAIPLYFALFGFDSPYMFNLSASLPFRGEYLRASQKGRAEEFSQIIKGYTTQKLPGLVFLHALTLVRMAPEESSSIEEIKGKLQKENTNKEITLDPQQENEQIIKEKIRIESEALETSLKYFIASNQVDPKMQLMIMSRRPFSTMLDDIGINTNKKYSDFFKLMMGNNFNFDQIPFLFNSTNYGEQFLDEKTKEPKSLIHFIDLFHEDFVAQQTQVLRNLLENGVLTTTMLRNLKNDITVEDGTPVTKLLNNYYENVLDSVQFPEYTLMIDLETRAFKKVPYKYDALSPPWFVNLDNSMGAFKQNMLPEEKEFGEAIIEVRAIPHVSAWFLNRCKLSEDVTGSFLKALGPQLTEHTLKLFDFLSTFGSESDNIGIFYLGMPYAVRTY